MVLQIYSILGPFLSAFTQSCCHLHFQLSFILLLLIVVDSWKCFLLSQKTIAPLHSKSKCVLISVNRHNAIKCISNHISTIKVVIYSNLQLNKFILFTENTCHAFPMCYVLYLLKTFAYHLKDISLGRNLKLKLQLPHKAFHLHQCSIFYIRTTILSIMGTCHGFPMF